MTFAPAVPILRVASFPWGSREVHVFDADRHVIRFGSGVPEGAPLGPWLDEEGVYWMPDPGGGWTRVEPHS